MEFKPDNSNLNINDIPFLYMQGFGSEELRSLYGISDQILDFRLNKLKYLQLESTPDADKLNRIEWKIDKLMGAMGL